MMQTLTFKARTDKEGIIRLEIPTNKAEQDIEIVVVMQTSDNEPRDNMGYPLGYFEETYGMFADDPIVRNQPSQSDIRDEIE
jgi:hypothetical protein